MSHDVIRSARWANTSIEASAVSDHFFASRAGSAMRLRQGSTGDCHSIHASAPSSAGSQPMEEAEAARDRSKRAGTSAPYAQPPAIRTWCMPCAASQRRCMQPVQKAAGLIASRWRRQGISWCPDVEVPCARGWQCDRIDRAEDEHGAIRLLVAGIRVLREHVRWKIGCSMPICAIPSSLAWKRTRLNVRSAHLHLPGRLGHLGNAA
jgi:hypothetical protein